MSPEFTPFNVGPYKNSGNKGYNSWWKDFNKSKPDQTAWDFKGSLSKDDDLFAHTIGKIAGVDMSKDGLLDEDEFLSGIGDVFDRSKLTDVFELLDHERDDVASTTDKDESRSKDGSVDTEEFAAFLKTVDKDGSNTISYKEMNNFINAVTGSGSEKNEFLADLETNYTFLTGAERWGDVEYIRTLAKDKNDNDISLFQGKEFSDFPVNKHSVYNKDAEDKELYFENGAETDFFGDELEYTDSETLSSYNAAVFAHGLIDSLGGKNGRLAKSIISKLDDENEKKFLQAVAGSDGDLNAQEMYVLLNVMDRNHDGVVDSEEQEKFYDPDADDAIKYSRSRSSDYNAHKSPENIKTLGDLAHYVKSVVAESIKDPYVDFDTFNRAEKDVRHKSNGEIDEETYDPFKYFGNGSKVKKLFDEAFEFTSSEDQNPANTAAFLKGLEVLDIDKDGRFSAKELGNRAEVKKLVNSITGEDQGSLNNQDLAIVLGMIDSFGTKDGKITTDESRKFFKFVRDLKVDDEMSDNFDPFGSSVFSGENKMVTTEDFKRFFEIVSDKEADEGDAELFEINDEAFEYVTKDLDKYTNFIKAGWSILAQLDNNKLDGQITREEYRKAVEANASSLSGSAKENLISTEMKKFSQIASLSGDSSILTLGEYTAAARVADMNNDNNMSISTADMNKFRDMVFNKDSKDYDPKLKQEVAKLAQQIENSSLLQDELKSLLEAEKERRKKVKPSEKKEDTDRDTNTKGSGSGSSGYNYEALIQMLLQRLYGQGQGYGKNSQPPTGYYHYSQDDNNYSRDFESSLSDYFNNYPNNNSGYNYGGY